jgi:outer membrane receptor protein involved in Fe transport
MMTQKLSKWNPALRPQFTNSVELGYKSWEKEVYTTLFITDFTDGTITKFQALCHQVIFYATFQNVNKVTTQELKRF